MIGFFQGLPAWLQGLIGLVLVVMAVAWVLMPVAIADLQRQARRQAAIDTEALAVQRAILAALQRDTASPAHGLEAEARRDPREPVEPKI